MTSMDLPPEPSYNYHLWRKDVDIWRKLTDIPKVKMGFALQYVCRTNERLHEAVLNIAESEVDGENGIENVLKELDKLHQIDEKDVAFTSYNDFMSLHRQDNQTVAEFILKFDEMLQKVESFGNHFSETYLAYKLLRSANITIIEERIVKASTSEFTIKSVKDTLRRMFGETICTKEAKENTNSQTFIKDHKEGKTFYTKKQKNINKSTFSVKNKHIYLKNGKNPFDKFGNITHCHLCFSVNHWRSVCPDRINKNVVKSDKAAPSFVLFGEQARQTKDERFYHNNKFNNIVGINIINVKGQFVIILVDSHTKYLEAGVVISKDAKVVIDFLLQNWIGIFGSPNKFVLFDSFPDEEIIDLANSFNINLVIDVGEYCSLIRLVENFSKLMHEHICEILQDVDCPCFAAVAWSASALNSLQNSSDFSPSQLAFGHNIFLPSVLGSKPPVLTPFHYNKLLQDHFEAKRKARNLHVYVSSTQTKKKGLVNIHGTKRSIDSKLIGRNMNCGLEKVLDKEKCEDLEKKYVDFDDEFFTGDTIHHDENIRPLTCFIKYKNQATNNKNQEKYTELNPKEGLTKQDTKVCFEPESTKIQSLEQDTKRKQYKIPKEAPHTHFSEWNSGPENIYKQVNDIVKVENGRSLGTFITSVVKIMKRGKLETKRKKRKKRTSLYLSQIKKRQGFVVC